MEMKTLSVTFMPQPFDHAESTSPDARQVLVTEVKSSLPQDWVASPATTSHTSAPLLLISFLWGP